MQQTLVVLLKNKTPPQVFFLQNMMTTKYG